MNYVLDTNAVSAIMQSNARVVERLRRHRRADVGIPQPVLAELEYGIARLSPSRRKTALEDRLNLIRSEIARIEWTDAVSEAFGVIKAALEKRRHRIEDFDAAIAAHAVGHGAVLVTADRDHMERVAGLTVEDWSAAT